MSVHIDPQEIYNRLYQAGADWADKDEAARLLEKTKDSVLAQLTQQVVAAEPGISMTQAKMQAEASKGYRDHIEAMCKAKGEANLARVKYDAAQAWFEGLRTKAATLRQELRTMPHQT